MAIGVRPQIQHLFYRVIAFIDQAIAQLLKLVKQHHLLVVAIFQLIQRLADGIHLALAQHFTNQLQLAAATFHLDTLGQLNGGTQVRIKRDLVQRVFPQIHQFRAQAF